MKKRNSSYLVTAAVLVVAQASLTSAPVFGEEVESPDIHVATVDSISGSSALVNSKPVVGTVIEDNGIKYKVLSVDGDKPKVQIGNGLYPIQFTAEQDDKPYRIPSEVVISGVTYEVTRVAEEALAYYADESGLLTYYPSSIEIPSSVTIIEKNGFKGSKAKTVSFEAGSQLTKIEDGAFSFTELEEVLLPASLEYIGNRGFDFNEKLRKVSFEQGSKLEMIAHEAFSNLPKLEEIILPKSVKTIGNALFRHSSGLKSVYVEEGNEAIVSQDGILYSRDMSKLIYYPARKSGDTYRTPDSVKQIEAFAFNFNQFLKNVEIGEGVEVLPTFVFADALALEKVTLPLSLKKIERLAFYGNLELKELTIPNQVTEFGENPFNGLPKLETLVLGKGVREIPRKFLAGRLDSLKEIRLLNKDDKFSVQETSFDVPETVKFIVQTQSIKEKLAPNLSKGNPISIEEMNPEDINSVETKSEEAGKEEKTAGTTPAISHTSERERKDFASEIKKMDMKDKEPVSSDKQDAGMKKHHVLSSKVQAILPSTGSKVQQLYALIGVITLIVGAVFLLVKKQKR
ncbi:leucine-rich repeat protein [Streptococcus sp. 20-1249]|uniref:leucine-rich repeat protein n=1 Tax=Streptococcus hepaticus TaxID=3349163 RepID=UPI003747A288